MDVKGLGAYIRNQRESSRLSLRKLSAQAGVSIPYLSQVERGLRKPSAEILQAIAKGLRVSAESLYVQAGILEDRPAGDVTAAITADRSITEHQKLALLQIYQAFRDAAALVGDRADAGPAPAADVGSAGPARRQTTRPRKSRSPSNESTTAPRKSTTR